MLLNKLSKLIEGLFLKLESEKRGEKLDNKELCYLSTYRAQGCLAVISRWVLGGFEDTQEMISKMLSILDESTEKLFLETHHRK